MISHSSNDPPNPCRFPRLIQPCISNNTTRLIFLPLHRLRSPQRDAICSLHDGGVKHTPCGRPQSHIHCSQPLSYSGTTSPTSLPRSCIRFLRFQATGRSLIEHPPLSSLCSPSRLAVSHNVRSSDMMMIPLTRQGPQRIP